MNIRLTCLALGALNLVACGGGGGSNAPSPPRQVNAAPAVSTAGNQTLIANQAGKTVTVAAEEKSMQQFARTVFSAKADEDPELINAVDFVMDAQDDDFADLLQP